MRADFTRFITRVGRGLRDRVRAVRSGATTSRVVSYFAVCHAPYDVPSYRERRGLIAGCTRSEP